MGKGGPLAFLNKKTWHPGRVQNLEEVWKREQEASKEEQKLKEYAKQLQEERSREELAQVAEAAGHKIKSDRLDWMYQGGIGQRQEADQRHEAQQAAAAAAAAPDEAPPPGADGPPGGALPAPRLPAFYAEDTPASANEMWQRLHADPLFAIKQQELAARRNIVANPVKMREIKQQVKELKQLAGSSKKEKKAKKEKKQKKEKRSNKDRRSRSASPSSGSEPERGAPARRPSPPRPTALAPPRREDERRDSGVRRGEGERGGLGSGYRGRRASSRSRSRSRGRGGDRYDVGERRDWRPSSRERGSGRDRYDDGRSRRDDVRHGPWGRSRSRSPRRGRSRDRSRERRREQAGAQPPRADRAAAQQQQQEQAPQKAPGGGLQGGAANGVKVHMDAASAQGKSAQYGINWASHVPEEARKADRSDFAEATRQRLEEAARKKEAEAREAVAQRYQRREYKTGKLTEEERQARLAEMMGNAAEHEAERAQRLKRQADREAAEEAAAAGRHHTDTAQFLQAATKDVYGTTQGGSLEDTVGRRAAFSDRGGGAAFRRN